MQRKMPLRERLNDAAGWITAGLGLTAVVIITALSSSPDNALGAGLLFVGLLGGSFAAILVHELGHAIAAWLVGWRVWIISVLGIIVRPGHAPRLSTRLAHDVGGYVLGSPPEDTLDTNWRSIAFSAGGPLASVLTGPLFIAWLATLPRDGWETPTGAGLLGAALAFAVMSAWSAIMTLWPIVSAGRPNDMAMILSAAFERPASRDVRGAMWGAALLEYGVEPRAWPRWVAESVSHLALSPWAPPAATLVAFLAALDAGDHAKARAIAEHGAPASTAIMRAYLAALDGDADGAQQRLAGIDPAPMSETRAMLHSFTEARILASRGHTADTQRALNAIADRLDSGAPQPFWEALLAGALSHTRQQFAEQRH